MKRFINGVWCIVLCYYLAKMLVALNNLQQLSDQLFGK